MGECVEAIIVIGAGQAGCSLAFKLREFGYAGRIILVGEEPEIPYQRPPLSKKYLSCEVEEERLFFVKSKEIFERDSIEVILGQKVISVDRDRKKVTLDCGEELNFSLLAFATGSSPRRLPSSLGGELSNVFTLRTLSDARKLREEFKPDRNLLVVGGGYIGLETAAVAQKLGMNVVLIEQASSILQRVAAKETASYFRSLHQEKGVCIYEEEGLVDIVEADNRAVRAQLTSGKVLPVDVIVSGIGIMPETTLAEATGLEVDNGIVVNKFGRTSDSNIYAAGECTTFPYLGNMVRLESVQNAIEQAETVALAMLGDEKEYLPVPWFWSDQYTSKLQIAGLNLGYKQVVCRPGTREGMSVWYFDGSRFLAVDAINDPKAFMLGKKWLRERKNPDVKDLSDHTLDLKSVSFT